MIFENINTYSILTAILFILFLIYFFIIYLKNNKKILSLIFLSISVFFLIIGLFSPRYWNYDKNIEVSWWNILFVLDVSKSMNVYDIWDNDDLISRLEAQKWALNTYIQNNSQHNFSLFAFAGETLELLPFTNDIGLFQTILNWVDQNNISKYWSNFDWLFQIISQYVEKEENAGTVVIFTDWWEIEDVILYESLRKKIETHDSNVILVWVWTNKWDFIVDWQDIFWRIQYKTYENEKVISQLNKKWIESVSDKYWFEYTFIESVQDFENIEHIINPLIQENLFQKNINLARDISYIFIILFLFFFSLFLLQENKINK